MPSSAYSHRRPETSQLVPYTTLFRSKIVGDRGRKWRAEHRDGGGVDQARPIAVADRTNRFEQRARAVEVDAIALVEIEFGFAGDDAGDRKSTRLNSSHTVRSYAVFCLQSSTSRDISARPLHDALPI